MRRGFHHLLLTVLSIYYNNIINRPAKTIEDKVQETQAKRKAARAVVIAGREAGWVRWNPKECCFLRPHVPREDSFATFKCRIVTSYGKMFREFVTDAVMDANINSIEPARLALRSGNTPTSNLKSIRITPSKWWKSMALQIRIIGRHIVPQENTTGGAKRRRPARVAIEEGIAHFRALPNAGKVFGVDIFERLIAVTLLNEHEELISNNFRSVMATLGEAVAGDEKLYFFTGKSGDVRLVVSKPDKIGLWFYELCVKLKNDKSFMLWFQLQTNKDNEPITVNSIVTKWRNILKSFPNWQNTMLVFDNYYLGAESRADNLAEGIMFSASMNPQRFGPEVKMIHDDGGVLGDKEGEHKTMWNEVTKELLTYHFDRQKGVGKKYNLSRGFSRSTDKYKIAEHKDDIPGYDYYKHSFEPCDNFNRGLHDKTWPHKRGGNGYDGDSGCAHDFIMACILQNTFNATSDINKTDGDSVSFEDKCAQLSDELFIYANTLH